MAIKKYSSHFQILVSIYCPDHAGVRGKEQVDVLASNNRDGQRRDREGKHKLGNDTRKDEAYGPRMTGFGIKCGSGQGLV